MKKSEYMYMYNWIGLPRWIMVKNLPAKAGGIRDTDSSCGLGRSPGGRHGNPLQYYNLENPMDRGAGRLLVIGAAKSWTQLKRLSTCAGVTELLRCSPDTGRPRWCSGEDSPAQQDTWVQFLGWDDSLKKEIATHSSILAWQIPWTEEPGGSQRVGHDWATDLTHTHTHTAETNTTVNQLHPNKITFFFKKGMQI